MSFGGLFPAKSRLFKVVACLLIQSLAIPYSLVFAVTGVPAPAGPAVAEVTASSLSDIYVPKKIGARRDKFEGTSEKVVIHIQDAHCNYEAQKNIAGIIQHLMDNYGVNFVAVEGADKHVDTSWFRSFPEAEIRREVADFFMKKGELTGTEFLSITGDKEFTIYGAEDKETYVKNLRTFLDCYAHKQGFLDYFGDIKKALNSLKKHIYSRELRELDRHISMHESKETELDEYASYLDKTALENKIDLMPYENFTTLIKTLKYEKDIDFDAVNIERADLVDQLDSKLSREDMTKLAEMSVDFKLDKIDSSVFHTYLGKLAEDNGIDIGEKYPNLKRYIIYSRVYSKINSEDLFSEIDLIVAAIKDSMFTDDTQRELDRMWTNINIVLGLINIELTNDKYEYYKANSGEFSADTFIGFINRQATRFGLSYTIPAIPAELERLFPLLADFYQIAVTRDRILVENMFEGMAKERTNVAVLITGGFHTKGITDILKGEGVSYVVLTPTLKVQADSPYLAVLSGQSTFSSHALMTTIGKTGESGLAPYLMARLLAMEEVDDMLKTRHPDDFKRAWTAEYVRGWFGAVVPKLQEMGLDLANRALVTDLVERSINIAIDKVNESGRNVSDTERAFILEAAREEIAVLMSDDTRKAPGSDDLNVANIVSIRSYINGQVEAGAYADVPVSDSVKGLIRDRAPPMAGDLLAALDDGSLVLRMVDSGPRIGFLRKEGQGAEVFDFTYKEKGVTYVCVTRAFLFLNDPTHSYFLAKLAEKSPETAERSAAVEAQLLYHAFVSSRGVGRQEAYDNALGLSTQHIADRGVSDLDLFILDQATNENAYEYLRALLDSGVGMPFSDAVIRALSRCMYMNFSMDQIEELLNDQNSDIALAAQIAKERLETTIDASLKAAAKKGGIFKGQDLRGTALSAAPEADVEITYEVALRLGQSLAKSVMDASGKKRVKIGVGKDVRLTSPKIQRGLMDGIRKAGSDVVDLGVPLMSTPMASFAAYHFGDLDASVEITASHNDWTYGGVKIILGKENMPSDMLQEMTARAGDADALITARRQGKYEQRDLMTPYRENVKQKFIEWLGADSFKGLTIAVDAAGGVYGFFADIVEELGGQAIRVNCEPNGLYPEHIPNPVTASGIQQLTEVVKANPGSIGVSFDSDGDRIAFVAEGGRVVSNHEILCLLAQGTDGPVVVNSRASLGVFDEMTAKGGTAKKARSGYAFVKAMARSMNAPVAGEESGHFMFGPDYIDDGIMTAGRVFGIVAEKKAAEGKTFAEAATETAFNRYVSSIDKAKVELKKQPGSNSQIPNDQWKEINQEVIDRLIAHFSTPEMQDLGFWLDPAVQAGAWSDVNNIDGSVDGFMVYFGRRDNGLPLGWALYRPSLSQPDKVYIDLEADTADQGMEIAGALHAALSEAVQGVQAEDGTAADMSAATALINPENAAALVREAIKERDLRVGRGQTKKAPGTDDVTDAEEEVYLRICDNHSQLVDDAELEAIISDIANVASTRAPPGMEEKELLDFLREGVLKVCAVDLEAARAAGEPISDLRFLPRDDKRMMGTAAYFVDSQGKNGEFGKYYTTVFIPRAMLDECRRNKYLLTTLLFHEYWERFGTPFNGLTRHGQASRNEIIVSSPAVARLGISEFTKFYLDEAEKEKNLDYLYYLLDTYASGMDPKGHYLRYLHKKIHNINGDTSARVMSTPAELSLWYRNQLEYEADPGRVDGSSYGPLSAAQKAEAAAMGMTEDDYKKFSYPTLKMRQITTAVEALIDNELVPGEDPTERVNFVKKALFRVDLHRDMKDFVEAAPGQNYLRKKRGYPSTFGYRVAQGDRAFIWMPKAPIKLESEKFIKYKFNLSAKAPGLKINLDKAIDFLESISKSIDSDEAEGEEITDAELKELIGSSTLDDLTDREREDLFSLTDKDGDGNVLKVHGKRTRGLLVKRLGALVGSRADAWVGDKISDFVNFMAEQIIMVHGQAPSGRVIVGIEGAGGAGKSTIVKMIMAAVRSRNIECIEYGTDADDYLYPKALRYKNEELQRIPWIEGGAMYNTIHLRKHLTALKEGRSFKTKGDPKTGKLGAEITPASVNIIEGVYPVHERETRELFDFIIVLADEKDDGDKEKFLRKMRRDAHPFLGRDGFTLPFGFWDYAKKQYGEQRDIIEEDTRNTADVVWRQDTNSAYVRKRSGRVPVIRNEYARVHSAFVAGIAEYKISGNTRGIDLAVRELITDYNSTKGYVQRARREAVRDVAREYPIFSRGLLGEIRGRLEPAQQSILGNTIDKIREEVRTEVGETAVAVIPVGGTGSRAYPFSTLGVEGKTKPVRSELSRDGESLTAHAIERGKAASSDSAANIVLITSDVLGGQIVHAAENAGVRKDNVITEPAAGDTLVAMGMAAITLEKKMGKGMETVMTVLTSDHDIPDMDMLEISLKDAQVSAALEPVVALLGIAPASSDPSMGYIKKGHEDGETLLAGISQAVEFGEKPDTAEDAQEFINQGRVWNSGKFIFSIRTLYSAMKEFAPEYYEELMKIRNAIGTDREQEVIAEAYKKFVAWKAQGGKYYKRSSFEKLIVEKLAGEDRAVAFGLTAVKGPKRWADLGSLACRPVNAPIYEGNNYIKGPVHNVERDPHNVQNCNVWVDAAHRIHLYGVRDMAVAYNPEIDTVVAVPIGEAEKTKDLFESLRNTSKLRKYVVRDQEELEPTERVSASVVTDEDGNTMFLDVHGDSLILSSRDVRTFSDAGLVATTHTNGITIIKQGTDIYVYGPEARKAADAKLMEIVEARLDAIKNTTQTDLATFHRARDDGSLTADMTKELADRASSNFLSYYFLSDGEILEEAIEIVAGVGALPNDALSKPAIKNLFGNIVERLCDSHTRKDRDAYYRVFSQVIDICRRSNTDEGRRMDEQLKAFGINSTDEMVARNTAVREATEFDPARAPGIRKVFVPYRVSIGSDISISSVIIKRMTEMFPNAEIIILGNWKLKGIFEGHPRVRVVDINYERRGGLLTRLNTWFLLLGALEQEGFDSKDCVFADPGSRLLQLGLLPIAADDADKARQSYFVFEMTMATHDRGVGEESARWTERIFPHNDENAYPALFLNEEDIDFAGNVESELGLADRYTVSMSLGVGGNWDKSLTDGDEDPVFEARLIDRVIEEGNVMVLDKGFGEEEETRAEYIEKEQAAKGTVVVEYITLPNGEIIMLPGGYSEREVLERDAKGRPSAVKFTYRSADGTFAASWVEAGREMRDFQQAGNIDEIRQNLARDFKAADRGMVAFRGSIGGFGALVQRSKQYIGYDSFGQHMANALSIPVVSMFAGYHTPDFPEIWKPYGSVPVELTRADTMNLGKDGVDHDALREESLGKLLSIKKGLLVDMASQVVSIAVRLEAGEIDAAQAVTEAREHLPADQVKGDMLANIGFIAKWTRGENYGVSDKVLARALRIMQLVHLSRSPVITDLNLVRYAWAGEGNRAMYGKDAPAPGEHDIAEAWHGSTVIKDGRENNPTLVSNTALQVGEETLEPVHLKDIIDASPSVLGGERTAKSFFVKFLSARFSNKVHMGFNESILQVGEETFEETFIAWLVEDRKNMEELRNSLRENMTLEEFEEYLQGFEQWTTVQAEEKWRVPSSDPRLAQAVGTMQRFLKDDVNASSLLNKVAMKRAEIVSTFNEIDLEDGLIMVVPCGYPHARFGLSHQTHPTEERERADGKKEYPKNEAWIIISVTDSQGRSHQLMVEPQQMSNDTYSFADLYTPIVWDANMGSPKMRKDVTDADIAGFVENGLYTDRPTTPGDFIRQPVDITPQEGVQNARVESLIDGTSVVWPVNHFVVHRVSLDGKGVDNIASMTMPNMPDSFHELLVTKGTVTVRMAGQPDIRLEAGAWLPIWAGMGEYVIEAEGEAEVQKFAPGESSAASAAAAAAAQDGEEEVGGPAVGTPGPGQRAGQPEPDAEKTPAQETAQSLVDKGPLSIEQVDAVRAKKAEGKKMRLLVHKELVPGNTLRKHKKFFRAFMYPDSRSSDDYLLDFSTFTTAEELAGKLDHENYTNVVITSSGLDPAAFESLDELQRGLIQQARMLTVQAPPVGEEANMFFAEILATAVRVGLMEQSDVEQKSELFREVVELMKLFTNKLVIADSEISRMLPSDEDIVARVTNLITTLLMTMPVERLEVDEAEIINRRQVMWSA